MSRDWCAECKYKNTDGREDPCVSCEAAYDNEPTNFEHKKPRMEIKEAIEIFRAMKSVYHNTTILSALDMAISALQKTEGKNPFQACGHATVLFQRDIPTMQYCPICGQKIDWGK